MGGTDSHLSRTHAVVHLGSALKRRLTARAVVTLSAGVGLFTALALAWSLKVALVIALTPVLFTSTYFVALGRSHVRYYRLSVHFDRLKQAETHEDAIVALKGVLKRYRPPDTASASTAWFYVSCVLNTARALHMAEATREAE